MSIGLPQMIQACDVFSLMYAWYEVWKRPPEPVKYVEDSRMLYNAASTSLGAQFNNWVETWKTVGT